MFRIFALLPTVLTSVNQPASHASVEMHKISSYRHAVIHYCVGWCDVCFVTVQQRHTSVEVVCFFSHSPLEHSSHTGEQHRAAGCAS